ncbi:MAG: LysM peptidoglycan-binding domain-containing protein [Verrucomicrobia bacterium]|nr:LysM peptidoglycan-binding domain-containing protein [Verrucomicrobiota bacterium]
MKLLRVFGLVAGVHALALLVILANPGCSTAVKAPPVPSDTVLRSADAPPPAPAPAALPGGYVSPPESVRPVNAPVTPPPAGAMAAAAPAPDDVSPATVRFVPTRPGTPVAGALAAEKVAEVTPASTYVVRPGDSLWTIARRHKLAVSDLTAANGLAANAALQPGRKLVIPSKSAPVAAGAPSTGGVAAPKAAEPAPAPKVAADGVRHVVQSGETLGVIARNYGVRSAEIAVANRITDPARIRAGSELIIPGWQAVNGKAAKAPAAAAAAPAPAAPPAVPVLTSEPAPAVPVIRIDEGPVSPAPKP